MDNLRPPPLIAVDARSALGHQSAGVPVFTRGLVASLKPLATRYRFLFVVDQSPDAVSRLFPEDCTFFQTRVRLDDWHSRDLWLELVLPRWLERLGVAAYLGPDAVIPTFFPASFKRVSVIHDLAMFTPFDGQCLLKKLKLRWDYWRYARAADLVLTDSDFSRETIAHRFPFAATKTVVIHSGIQPVYYEPVDEVLARRFMESKGLRKGSYLLYFGGYKLNKNVRLLVRSLGFVSRELRQPLVLAGNVSPDVRRQLSTLARERSVDEHLVYTGYVSSEELKYLCYGCSAFVFPSLYEGFGLPPVEAMACGAPVIYNPVASLPEVCGEAGLRMTENTPESLGQLISRLLGDQALQEQLRKKGRLNAERFLWKLSVQRLGLHFDQLLS